jgi:hypothetical protein
MENTICAQLYEIAEHNMTQSGNAFTHPRAAFLYYAKNDPHAVDLIALMREPATNMEFVEIAYLAILNRPIDADAARSWQKYAHMSQEKFRRLVVQRLTAAPEASLCHKRIYHNLYAKKRRWHKQGLAAGVTQKLLPLYRKLPDGMKQKIRNITGADTK